MADSPTTAAIILAAGTSSRMGAGRHKLLLPLAGRPVLAHVIEAALSSQARPIIVVLGHQGNEVRIQLAAWLADPAIIVVDNPNYLQGMSTSMRTGIQTLITYGYMKSQPVVDSALIILGDQPLITSHIIDALIHAHQTGDKGIVAPLYDGQRGNPVLFRAAFFPELLEAEGDEGGRTVLQRHRAEVATIDLGDAARWYDVDTWEAYQEVVTAWQNNQ
jgi:molybdenum cofactor cytidylyltransferase